MKRKAVVFDWDGTLIDTDFLMDAAFELVLMRRGLTHQLKCVEPILYKARSEGALLRAIKIPVDNRSEIIAEVSHEFKKFAREACLFPGSKELLSELKSRNIPIGIFTGRDRISFEEQVARLLPSRTFDICLCREDAPLKPNPEGLRKIQHALGSEQIIYIGNTIADLACAKSAGASFIAVDLCTRTCEPLIVLEEIDLKNTYPKIREAILEFSEIK